MHCTEEKIVTFQISMHEAIPIQLVYASNPTSAAQLVMLKAITRQPHTKPLPFPPRRSSFNGPLSLLRIRNCTWCRYKKSTSKNPLNRNAARCSLRGKILSSTRKGRRWPAQPPRRTKITPELAGKFRRGVPRCNDAMLYWNQVVKLRWSGWGDMQQFHV